jgi:hypothetical protein
MIYKAIDVATSSTFTGDLIDTAREAGQNTDELFKVRTLMDMYEAETNVTIHAAYNDADTEMLGFFINSFVGSLWYTFAAHTMESHRRTGVFTFMCEKHIRLAHEAGCTIYQSKAGTLWVTSSNFNDAWNARTGIPKSAQKRDGVSLIQADINGPLKTDLVFNVN